MKTIEEFKEEIISDFVVAYQRHSGDQGIQLSVDSFMNDFISDFARRRYMGNIERQKELRIELRKYYDIQKVQKP